jgi:hypothetical protein
MNVDFHDANLVSIQIGQQKEIRITCELQSGQTATVRLSGVSHFRCNDFREGNIVFEFECIRSVKVDKSEFKWLLDVDKGEFSDYIDKLCDQVEQGQLEYVKLTPSYGAMLSALCERCQVDESDEQSVLISR